MRIETPHALLHARRRRALSYIACSTATLLREGPPKSKEQLAALADELSLLKEVAESGQGQPIDTPGLRDVFRDFDLVVRDDRGEVHCPCGAVTGRNLRDEMPPLLPCSRCSD